MIALCMGVLPSAAVPHAVAAQGSATPCAANTNDEIRDLVTQFNDAFDQHDVDALAAMVSPEIVRDSPRGDDTGVDDMVASFTKFFEVFPDLSTSVDEVLVDAPLAAIRYTTTGTQATTFAGTEPSGEPVSWDGMYLITVECGKIVQLNSQVDQLSQRNQTTSTPATPVADDAASPASCPDVTKESATALMDTWYHEVWTGKTDLLATLTTPDIYHHWAQGPDSSGQDAQLAHVQATLDMLPGLTSDYDAIVVDGNSIAVHWTQSLGDDSWGGINFFHTECGLISEVWSEMDLNDLPGTTAEATPGA
jgi:steroid delta-isomerase-like uncharacterized protein